MIDFSWSFYFQVVCIILIVYYICVYIFLRRLKKKMSGLDNAVSKSAPSSIDESEFESDTDQETFVKQISIADLLADKLSTDDSPELSENMTCPESYMDTPDDVIETPRNPLDLEEIPSPDEPYLDFIDPEIPTPTIPEMDNMDTETEDSIEIYEPVDISIEENETEETYIIDGAVIEDFKEEFSSSESIYKKKVQSFEEIMQANPELQKAMLQN